MKKVVKTIDMIAGKNSLVKELAARAEFEKHLRVFNRIEANRAIQVEIYKNYNKARTITGIIIFKGKHFFSVQTRRRIETISFADLLNGHRKIIKLQRGVAIGKTS